MSSEISLESILQARAAWLSLSQRSLISDVLPTESFIRESTDSLQTVKKSLISKTKDFRASHPQTIPPESALELLTLYQSELSKVRTFVKTAETAIARLFARLVSVDDPAGLLRAIISKLRVLPDFESELSDLKSQAELARQKTGIVSSLRESLSQLKRECEEPVSVAAAAHSQSLPEWDNSLSELQAQRTAAELSLKALEAEVRLKSERRDDSVRLLRETELSVDRSASLRRDQLELSKSSLREVETTAEEFARLQVSAVESGIVLETQRKLLETQSEIQMIDGRLAALQREIGAVKGRMQLLSRRAEQLEAAVVEAEQTLETLPSQLEWGKVSAELAELREIVESEEELNALKAENAAVMMEKEEIERRRAILQAEVGKAQSRVAGKGRDVEREIVGIGGDSEMIGLLKAQKQAFVEKVAEFDTLIERFGRENAEKRREKENGENEIAELKKQIARFPGCGDAEAPLVRMTSAERKRIPENQNVSDAVKWCLGNRTFRNAVLVYVVFLHFVVYFATVGRFLH